MKKLFISLFLSTSALITHAQTTAQDFTANDCSGVSHHLFDSLDAGKAVVICWVMPCSTCITPTQTAYNVVQTYLNTYPGRIVFYIADDFANTNCTSLKSGMVSANFPKSYWISNASVTESYYGAGGMPKIVILGKSTHEVFFKQNGGLDQTNFETKLTAALATAPNTTDVSESNKNVESFSLFPNPTSQQVTFSMNNESSEKYKIEMYNYLGECVSVLFEGTTTAGKTQLLCDIHDIPSGIYYVKYSTNESTNYQKLHVVKD